jgi:hypothetical protein
VNVLARPSIEMKLKVARVELIVRRVTKRRQDTVAAVIGKVRSSPESVTTPVKMRARRRNDEGHRFAKEYTS